MKRHYNRIILAQHITRLYALWV